ncbi:MAG: hypothetical protein U1E73_07585 [Planctomycetota bacterium]
MVEQLGRRARRERRRQRQALVQGDGQRVDVGGGGDLQIAAQLLGRRVDGRAGEAAGVRELERGVAREAEVGEHRFAAAAQQHVRRLDVAVHEAGGVHGGERVGDAQAEPDEVLHEVLRAEGRERQPQPVGDVLQRRRLAGGPHLPQVRDQGLQAWAVDVFHLEGEQLAVVDDAVDGDDVFVADLGERARLLQEAAPALRRQPERVRQHLQRDLAVELLLAGEVDGAHAAAADLAHDLVAEQRRPSGLAAAGDAAGEVVGLGDAGSGGGVPGGGGGEIGIVAVQQRSEQVVEQVRERRIDRVLRLAHDSSVDESRSPSSRLSSPR